MNSKLICAVISFASITTLANPADEYGGEITLWPKDHGKFLFVNTQKTVCADILARPVNALAVDFNIDIQLVDGSAPDLRAVPAELTKLKAKGAVWIVDDAALPRVLTATEDGWAVLNVSQINADKPEQKQLSERIFREVYRVFGFLNGTTDPEMMPQCVMKPSHGVKGLDELVCRNYSPSSFAKIQAYLAAEGYKQKQSGTYYDACEEGWAPAPTNAVQKSIWDKVHQLPTKPLTIQRESERNKGKK